VSRMPKMKWFFPSVVWYQSPPPLLSFFVEICEDLWMPIPPSSYAALAGATVLVNLSASNVTVGKEDFRRWLVADQSGRCLAAYLYAADTGQLGPETSKVLRDVVNTVISRELVPSKAGKLITQKSEDVIGPLLHLSIGLPVSESRVPGLVELA